jgi:uncharacterized membrane protein YedE/YeeE
MIFSIVVISTSFLVGFAMKRGGLCTYAAVLQIVNFRRVDRLFDFLGAAAWATLAVVSLSWWAPVHVSLSGTHDQIIMAVSGGLILGLGAYINRGCVFGTFVQLVGGNMTYMATLVGMSAGVIITHEFFNDIVPEITRASVVTQPGLTGLLWLLAAGLFALAMLFQFVDSDVAIKARVTRLHLRHRQAIFVMLVLGVGGGLLFAIISGWGFATVLTKATLNVLDSINPGPAALPIFCTLAMVAGGIYAAVSGGSFAIQAPRLLPFFGCLAGGALMGSAAFVIPGGNDGMLLKGIPSLAPHAIIGFVFMIVVMLILSIRFPNSRGYSIT